jgi:hypothetical protein
MSTLKFNRWQSVDGVTRNAVLQVVSAEVTTEFTSTSVTFVDATDMNLAITPTSATSKILVMFNPSVFVTRGSSSANYMDFKILRDSTEVFAPGFNNGTGNLLYGMNSGGATAVNVRGIMPLSFLDSPATTNEITYKMQTCVYVNSSGGSISINSGNTSSTITLMEIAQ